MLRRYQIIGALGALSILFVGGCASDDSSSPQTLPPAVIDSGAGGAGGAGGFGGTGAGQPPPAGCNSDIACGDGMICNMGACIPGECNFDRTCPPGQVCDRSTFTCSGGGPAPCMSDAECMAGSFCVSGTCQNVQCARDEHCPPMQRCENNRCVAEVVECSDGDGDGYGNGCMLGMDCDDANPNVNPGMREDGMTLCDDGVDNDCVGGDVVCGSQDLDRDGYEVKDGDCDDNNAAVNPGQAEVYYNNVDDDCNPATRDGDRDNDGFTAMQVGGDDCNDENPNINRAVREIPGNGIDEDCDGVDAMPQVEDQDGDGVSEADGDCNDENRRVYPGAEEIPYNNIDDDCDVRTPDNDLDMDGVRSPQDCDDRDAQARPGLDEIYYNNRDDDCDPETADDDADGDGFAATEVGGDDCNDRSNAVNPGSEESPYNGLDDDCDPGTPDNDLDGDGFPRGPDCDDRDENVNPDVVETSQILCEDDIDNNCDGVVVRCDVAAVDNDGDGVPQGQDCDDNNPEVTGGAEIIGNGLDDDCDPSTPDVPALDCENDAYDNTNSNNQPNSASAIRDGNTTGVQDNGLILCHDEADWYQIQLDAGDGLEVDLVFDADEGDIDMRLYRLPEGRPLNRDNLELIDSSASVDGFETVYLRRAVRNNENYYIEVFHYENEGGRQPYGITVNLFDSCTDDAESISGEQNDRPETASLFPDFGQSRQVCDYDTDYYSFRLDREDNVRVDILFNHAEGDIDARVERDDGAVFLRGSSADDNEIMEGVLPSGEYRVAVYGFNGAQNSYKIFRSGGGVVTRRYTMRGDVDIPDATDEGIGRVEVPIDFTQNGEDIDGGSTALSLRIREFDLNHRFLPDLRVVLLIDGVELIELWNRDGDENGNDGGLDDSGLLDFDFDLRRYDIYFSDRTYAEIAGQDAQGRMSVLIEDYNIGNDGTLVDLDVELTYLSNP